MSKFTTRYDDLEVTVETEADLPFEFTLHDYWFDRPTMDTLIEQLTEARDWYDQQTGYV